MIKKLHLNLMPVFIMLICMLPQPSWSEDEALKFYNLEVIVFKYKDLDYFRSETWSLNWDDIDTSTSIDLQYPNEQASNRTPAFSDEAQIKIAKLFKPLTQTQKTLKDSVQEIEKSTRYELLAYHAWQQPGLDSNTAIPVRIRSLNSLRHLEPITPQTVINNEFHGLEENTKHHYELDGTVKVILSRFLHIHLDLRLLLPVTLENLNQTEEVAERLRIKLSNKDTPGAKSFGINFRDHRRMRSNELHHIDHPLLGVLVIATPVKSN